VIVCVIVLAGGRPPQGFALVAYPQHWDQSGIMTLIVGAACGRDVREAGKRLAQDCKNYLRLESSYSSHSRQISKLPVETIEATHFLRRFKMKENPKWLFLKY
jgi:hypothetical protein